MNTQKNKVQQDPGMFCLANVLGFYGVSIDPPKIYHDLAIQDQKLVNKHILKAARMFKMKAQLVSLRANQLKHVKGPTILCSATYQYFILVKCEQDKCLILLPQERAPQMIHIEELREIYTGQAILLIPRTFSTSSQKFGFRWFIPSILKFKVPLVEVIFATFFIQVLGLASPMVTQTIIDKVLVHNSLSTLDVFAIGISIIILFETILSIVKNYLFTHTTSRIDIALSSRLFNHLLKLPLRYFETRRTGDTVARVRELENIRSFLTGAPMNTLLDVMFIAVYIVVMFRYSVSLTWVTLASLPIFAAVSLIVTPLFRSRLEEKFNCGAESQSYLVEMVHGIQTTKSFATEPLVKKKWESLLANYTTSGFKTYLLSGNANAISSCIQKLFDIGILWLGARLVIDGSLTVGQLIAFRMLSGRVSGPVLRMVQLWQDFQQASISVKRLGDIFNVPPEPEGSKSRMPNITGKINFDHVRFRYRVDGVAVINDISFQIPANTVLGIVGRSGSGKSTLSKLIQRLYIPENGRILIDGIDLSLADPVWLRRQIGVVLQENFLFNGTIRENIALNNPAAEMERIIAVAQIAGAHDFIIELSEGYDTRIGENGSGLSGGQKQRIAIARALLSNPRILIFDEATSALDYESESIIQNNLRAICKGRTVLIIAHRLSTLRDADAVMVLDQGRVIEYDSQANLIAKQGLYYHLLKQQNAGEVEKT